MVVPWEMLSLLSNIRSLDLHPEEALFQQHLAPTSLNIVTFNFGVGMFMFTGSGVLHPEP